MLLSMSFCVAEKCQLIVKIDRHKDGCYLKHSLAVGRARSPSRPRGLPFSWWGCYDLCHRHKPAKLAHSFLFCSCICFCLYGPFNSISFHKVSRQLFAFSLRSSGLISALLILSTIDFCMKVSLSPDIILWSTGLKAQTN